MKKIKYYVIGGQYQRYNYGGAYTLEGAKRLATKHIEYWDNWQGWHKPSIYDAESCEESENFYGKQILPMEYVEPIMIWNSHYRKWENVEW